jgi:hypothetical protein
MSAASSFSEPNYIERPGMKKSFGNWSRAVPTIELSRKTALTAKEQNLLDRGLRPRDPDQ